MEESNRGDTSNRIQIAFNSIFIRGTIVRSPGIHGTGSLASALVRMVVFDSNRGQIGSDSLGEQLRIRNSPPRDEIPRLFEFSRYVLGLVRN